MIENKWGVADNKGNANMSGKILTGQEMLDMLDNKLKAIQEIKTKLSDLKSKLYELYIISESSSWF